MALLGRMLVIALALVGASLAAAVVFNLAVGGEHMLDVLVIISALLIAGFALLPALVIIVLAEAFSLRSALFYGFAGGALALACFFGLELGLPSDLTDTELLGGEAFGIDQLFNRTSEIIAAAGIAAGLVYWLIAGRKAGAWRAPPPPPPLPAS